MRVNITAINNMSGIRTVLHHDIEASKLSIRRLRRGSHDQRFISYRSCSWADPVVLLGEGLEPKHFSSRQHPFAYFSDPRIEAA